jgi:hypothetical protein
VTVEDMMMRTQRRKRKGNQKMGNKGYLIDFSMFWFSWLAGGHETRLLGLDCREAVFMIQPFGVQVMVNADLT